MEELFVLAHGFQVSELSFHCDREGECQRAGVTAESWGRVEQYSWHSAVSRNGNSKNGPDIQYHQRPVPGNLIPQERPCLLKFLQCHKIVPQVGSQTFSVRTWGHFIFKLITDD